MRNITTIQRSHLSAPGSGSNALFSLAIKRHDNPIAGLSLLLSDLARCQNIDPLELALGAMEDLNQHKECEQLRTLFKARFRANHEE